MASPDYLTAGQYLGHRLVQLGCTTVLAVPGDFNLPLLDAFATVPGLRIVNVCSELVAAYAADGFARAKPGSLGCVVTTFLVGALSAINGVAGSFAEELPVLSLVGVPSTRQYSGMCSLHHTLGNAEDMSQEVLCYRPVTCYQSILRNMLDARYLIDKALSRCLAHRKPVLLEVCRDVAFTPHGSFGYAPPRMTPFSVATSASAPDALDAAADAVRAFFEGRRLPLIVAGRRVRTCQQALSDFADATGWGVILLHDAKGMFSEDHAGFLGVYSPFFTDPASVRTAFDAADAILFVGTHFDELSFGQAPDEALELRSVLTYKTHVLVGHTAAFNGVATDDLLKRLTGSLAPNSALVKLFRGLPATPPALPPADPAFVAPADAPLKMAQVLSEVQQQLLAGDTAMAVMVDTGDTLFRTQTLRLPRGTPYEIQMFASNIGWGCPAGLGFALGCAPERRLLVFSGDGGLQMTSGAVGDYVRAATNAILILVNNDGYCIERYISPISQASYNYVQRWDYALLAEAMCNKTGKYKVWKVHTETEARDAIAEAKRLVDHFCFIEVVVDSRDCTPAATALRNGFVGKHFSDITGYRNLPGAHIPGSATNGGASTLTGAAQGEAQAVAADSSLAGEAGTGSAPAAAGPVAALREEARSLRHAAGSSSCLAATGGGAADEPAPAAADGAGAAAAPGAGRAGTSTPRSLLPAKRPAQGEPGDSS